MIESRSTIIGDNGVAPERPAGYVVNTSRTLGTTPGRLPLAPSVHEERRRHERDALTKMSERARNLPPPVDEVRFWREKQRSYIVLANGETREVSTDNNHPHHGANAELDQLARARRWDGPAPTQVTKVREYFAKAHSVSHLTCLSSVDSGTKRATDRVDGNVSS